MASDLLSVLQLETDVRSKVVIIKEINNCDSSFISSSVLNFCIKNKHAVIIVSTHNSMLHYQQVGLKMNYSLQKHIDSGLVTVYNLGESVAERLMQNEQCSLEQQFFNLKDIIHKMLETHETVEIIMDGISHLCDLGYTLEDMNSFCNNIINLCKRINNSFVFFHCNVAYKDDVTYVLCNVLSHKAHIVLEVENLPSGLSADVSGHLVLKNTGLKFQKEHMYSLDNKTTKYLFKLFDKGVRLFAPGTV